MVALWLIDGAPTIDFKCPQATLELTRTLLLHDFGINWDIPIGQLVPPLTSRMNYIHWLEDLLVLSSPPGTSWKKDCECDSAGHRLEVYLVPLGQM